MPNANYNNDLSLATDALTSGKYSPAQIRQGLISSGYKGEDADALLADAHQKLAQMGGGGGQGGGPTFADRSGLSGIGQLLGLTGHALMNNPVQQWPQNLWDTLSGIVKGQAQDTTSELQKAVQSARGTNVDGRSAFAHLVGAVPLVGRPLADLGYDAHSGNYGATAGDALSILFPKLMEQGGGGLQDVGRTVYEDALHVPKTQVFPSSGELANLGFERGIPISESGSQKIGGYIRHNLQAAQTEIQSHMGMPINSQDALGPLMDAYRDLAANGLGDSPSVAAMDKRIDTYLKSFGNAIPIEKAQEVKSRIWKEIRDPAFQKSGSELGPQERALRLNAQGLKQAIERAVGPNSPLANANDQAWKGIALQDQIDALSAGQKSKLTQMLPYIAGAGGAGLGEALGIGGGGAGHLGVIVTGAGLAGLLAKLATREPAVMSRLALTLKAFGKGSEAAGQTAGRAGQLLRSPGVNENLGGNQ